ncbi:MAG: glucokinase [Gaiellales bacterium]|nr:glucokinase [Gaiellales bacterium]
MIGLLLVADVGGTKTDLAVLDPAGGPRAAVAAGRLPSADYPSLEALLAAFVGQQHVRGVTHASIAVAGPVAHGRAMITNLGWEPTEQGLARALELHHVRLLNDLEAIANAIPELLPEDADVLLPGTPAPGGAIAVVAPGTGLGEAFLVRNGMRFTAHPSEGGHCDFGPVDDEQVALYHWCERHFGHVSYERVCSGIGLPNLYRFLCESGRAQASERVTAALALVRDPTPVICEEALRLDPDPACAAAVALFVRILAQESGNLALRVLGTGGVFLAGGLARRLRRLLDPTVFAEAFRRKGRLGELLAPVPVSLVTADRVALLGAAVRGLED